MYHFQIMRKLKILKIKTETSHSQGTSSVFPSAKSLIPRRSYGALHKAPFLQTSPLKHSLHVARVPKLWVGILYEVLYLSRVTRNTAIIKGFQMYNNKKLTKNVFISPRCFQACSAMSNHAFTTASVLNTCTLNCTP